MGSILTCILAIGLVFFSPSKSLEDFRWEKRIVLLYGQDSFDRNYIEKHRVGLYERKLLLVHLKGNDVFWTNSEEELNVKSFLAVRGKMNPAPTWALIGLDGRVKSQGFGSPPMDKLFRLIDSMPMRQAELKKDCCD
jgi:hypothetical protein